MEGQMNLGFDNNKYLTMQSELMFIGKGGIEREKIFKISTN